MSRANKKARPQSGEEDILPGLLEGGHLCEGVLQALGSSHEGGGQASLNMPDISR